MTSPLDVIPVPGHPGMFARREAVEAWQRGGSPDLTYAGRLADEQERLWEGWVHRLPGYSPADNPNDPTQPLAHVRFVAFDIKNPDPVRLRAAGLVCPYKGEPWHWQLPGDVRRFPLVTSIPSTAGGGSTPFPTVTVTPKEYDMGFYFRTGPQAAIYFWNESIGRARVLSKEEQAWRAAAASTAGGAPQKIVLVSPMWQDRALALGTYTAG